jgi:hypothetical protein
VASPVAGATYTWTASAGTVNGSSYTFNTATAGAKTATVNAKVTAGGVTCQSANAANKAANVQALPTTPAITASAGTVCQNGALTFYVASPVANATYTWTASAGSQNGSSYTFNTATAGAKTATVRASVTAGGVTCQSANAANKTANVQALPTTPAITASAGTVCQNAALTFYVTSPVTGATYTWSASAGTANGSSYTFNTATAGAKTATVRASVTDGGVTCQSTSVLYAGTVTVAPAPPANAVSSYTGTIGPYTVSAPIRATASTCSLVSPSDIYNTPSFVERSGVRFYSVACYELEAKGFCPSPWRLITSNDHMKWRDYSQVTPDPFSAFGSYVGKAFDAESIVLPLLYSGGRTLGARFDGNKWHQITFTESYLLPVLCITP